MYVPRRGIAEYVIDAPRLKGADRLSPPDVFRHGILEDQPSNHRTNFANDNGMTSSTLFAQAKRAYALCPRSMSI
jgi:hypothetical protein